MSLPRTRLSTLSVGGPRPAGPPPQAPTSEQPPLTERTRALCFPRDDARFAERVEGLVDAAGPDGPIAAAVLALLREEYPLAVISPRHDLAAIDARRVWYAFRDGSLVPIIDGDTS